MEKIITVSNKGGTLDSSRINFLKLGGVGLMVAGFTLAGCRDDDCDFPMGMTFSIQEKGDVGILNYAQENITQAGFNTATLFGAAAGSASFDEILSETDAGGIAGVFVR